MRKPARKRGVDAEAAGRATAALEIVGEERGARSACAFRSAFQDSPNNILQKGESGVARRDTGDQDQGSRMGLNVLEKIRALHGRYCPQMWMRIRPTHLPGWHCVNCDAFNLPHDRAAALWGTTKSNLHAADWQKAIQTRSVWNESILNARDADFALEIVLPDPQSYGGPRGRISEAKEIHACRAGQANVAVWCGRDAGMRKWDGHNISLSKLRIVRLPGDVWHRKRLWKEESSTRWWKSLRGNDAVSEWRPGRA